MNISQLILSHIDKARWLECEVISIAASPKIRDKLLTECFEFSPRIVRCNTGGNRLTTTIYGVQLVEAEQGLWFNLVKKRYVNTHLPNHATIDACPWHLLEEGAP